MQAQSDEAAKAIANCWDYLDEHRGRTMYQKLHTPSNLVVAHWTSEVESTAPP
jgi:hypothetical protein